VLVILQMYAERPVQNRRRGDENRPVEDERGGITSIQT
jgi:hypothetical protein